MRRPDHTHRIIREPENIFHRHGAWFAWWYDKVDAHGEPCGPHRGIHLEWRFLPAGTTFGVGAEMKWGTLGSETTPDVSIHLGGLGDLWIQPERVFPKRWFDRKRPDGSQDYDSRVISMNVGRNALRWQLWCRAGHWSSTDPWWMRGSVVWRDVLLGRTAYEAVEVESGTTIVNMPEKNYPATYKVDEETWRHDRPLGRLRDRLLGPRRQFRTEVTPGEPIPVPGKGESSWDVGDDFVSSSSSPGRDVAEAAAKLALSAIKTRQRHGGLHMSVPA